MLPAEHRTGFGHRGLDEGVTDAGDHRHSPFSAMISGTAREVMIVNHRSAGDTLQFLGGDQSRQRRGVDQFTTLVDHETPVSVAVEGQTDVGPVLFHRCLQIDQVLRIDRVGLVVGEVPIELEVQLDHLGGQLREDHWRSEPRHAVAGIDHHLEPTLQRRHQAQQIVGVLLEHLALGDAAARAVIAGYPAHDHVRNVCQSTVLSDRRGPARHSLMPLYAAGL